MILPLLIATSSVGWALYATVFAEDAADEPTVTSHEVTCNFFYRERTFSRGGDGPIARDEAKFTINVPFEAGDMFAKQRELALPADDPQYHIEVTAKAKELTVLVTNARTKRPIAESRFTLDEQARNMFPGNHGFTGLSYVRHPDNDAEVQFWCTLKEVRKGNEGGLRKLFDGIFPPTDEEEEAGEDLFP